MMATRIVFNRKAFRELRTLPSVQDDLIERAKRIADAAGDGYVVGEPDPPRNRARAAVIASTHQARDDAARNGTLSRSLEAGR